MLQGVCCTVDYLTMKRTFLFLALVLLTATRMWAGDYAIKTNLAMDGLLNPNLGVETSVAPKWTIELTGQLNAWDMSHDRKWKHWMVQPEARYWFCRAFAGHFVGMHLIGGQYNMGNVGANFKLFNTDFRLLKDYRFQGWMGGAGVSYGYTWLLDRRWSAEAEIGLGWVYTRYDKFECADCGQRVQRSHPHNYVGPTRVAINIVYNF